MNRKPNISSQNYYFALLLSADAVQAAVWTVNDGKIEVISKAFIPCKENWDDIIAAADHALTDVSQMVAPEITLEKVIFGLEPPYVKEDKIIPEYLSKLKKLCQELSLKPVGFVTIPEAIAYLLDKQEGSPSTAILVGVENKKLSVSLFRIGKTVGMVQVPRTDSITKDLDNALELFTDVEILPSKILLYDNNKNLEPIRTELMHYQWQKKSTFLHFPRIERLDQDVPIEAVAIAGAAEITSGQQLDLSEIAPVESQIEDVKVIAKNSPSDTQKNAPLMETIDESSEEVRESDDTKATTVSEIQEIPEKDEKKLPETLPERTRRQHMVLEEEDPDVVDAATLGFGDDAVDNEFPKQTEYRRPRMEVVVTDEEMAAPKKSASRPVMSLPPFSLPSLPLPSFPTMRFGFIIVAILVVVGAALLFAAYWYIPRVTVTVLIDPKILRREKVITADPATTAVSDTTIPANKLSTTLTGTKTRDTSGKKTVGDKAKGQVTLYNKTTSSKAFSKGTILSGPKGLTFTLEDTVTVASVSDVIVGTPGKETVKVSATAIGKESNIPAGSDFSVKDFPVTSYAARNDQPFTGGSSREIQAVSKEDQTQLTDDLTNELLGKARIQINQELTSGQSLIDQTLKTTFKEKTFSQNVGDEAPSLVLNAALDISALAFNRQDVVQIVKNDIQADIPSGYDYSDKDLEIATTDSTVNTNQSAKVSFLLTAKLMPKIPVNDLKRAIAGSSRETMEKTLKEIKGVAGYEYRADRSIPFFPERLPNRPENITIIVQSR